MSTVHPHAHCHTTQATAQVTLRLAWSLGLTLAFVVVEIIAGWWANSLALLTDAAHNLTDVLALALSWYAVRLTAQPAHAGKTFGYHRVGILVALLNSATLLVIALGIGYEAYQRFLNPPPVNAEVLIGVGALAFIVNAGTAWLVWRDSEHDLNLRSAFLHLLGDALSTLGAVVAGLLIALTGLNWLDPLASALIGLLILLNAWTIVRETVDILLESTPHDIDMNAMVSDLLNIQGVRGVHDLHVWSLTRSLRACCAHIVTDDISISAGATIQHELDALLATKYRIHHTTLQLECEGCQPDLLYCDLNHPDFHHQHHHHAHQGRMHG